jgi:SpoVK/Ycf46/Vps4 family AAA+-type ATPase
MMFSKTDGVIILGATNRPQKIDPALLRSGRLEKHIIIPPPDAEALVGIIAHHLGLDLDVIVEQGVEVSMELEEDRLGDVPDRTPIKSAINVASPFIDKIVARDQKHTSKGAAND